MKTNMADTTLTNADAGKTVAVGSGETIGHKEACSISIHL